MAAALDEVVVNESHRLTVLRNMDLVETQRQGRIVVYGLHPEVSGQIQANKGRKHVDLDCCKQDLN